jgi:hypothetical protein
MGILVVAPQTARSGHEWIPLVGSYLAHPMSSREGLNRLLSESLHSEVACPYYRADGAPRLHIRLQENKGSFLYYKVMYTNGSILDHVSHNFFSHRPNL